MPKYSSAADAILSHRYGANYGSLPTQGSGRMQLQPVVAAGVDTGTVELVPMHPDPDLSGEAEDGIEMGFAEFMREFSRAGH